MYENLWNAINAEFKLKYSQNHSFCETGSNEMKYRILGRWQRRKPQESVSPPRQQLLAGSV